jgi:hypothetical protein
MQALPHLRAAVVHLHATVAVDKHQRSSLVEERGGERNAELDRRERQPALLVQVLAVPGCDLCVALLEVTRLRELAPDALNAISAANFLAVVRGVAGFVQISCTDFVGRQAELPRDARHDLLDDQHALRAPEATKCSVRDVVCATHATDHAHIRQVVAIVHVKHGPA